MRTQGENGPGGRPGGGQQRRGAGRMALPPGSRSWPLRDGIRFQVASGRPCRLAGPSWWRARCSAKMDPSEDSGRLGGRGGKEPACRCRRHGDTGWRPGSGGAPAAGHGGPSSVVAWRMPGRRSAAGCRPRRHSEPETTAAT